MTILHITLPMYHVSVTSSNMVGGRHIRHTMKSARARFTERTKNDNSESVKLDPDSKDVTIDSKTLTSRKMIHRNFLSTFPIILEINFAETWIIETGSDVFIWKMRHVRPLLRCQMIQVGFVHELQVVINRWQKTWRTLVNSIPSW